MLLQLEPRAHPRIRGLRAIVGTGVLACCSSSSPITHSVNCTQATAVECWSRILQTATSCLPPSSAVGSLSADGAECRFASGQTVEFAPPLSFYPSPANSEVGLTVTRGTSACLSFDWLRSSSELSLAGAQGKATVADFHGPSETITCPDGTVLTLAQLEACGYAPGTLPGAGLGSAPNTTNNSIAVQVWGPGASITITCVQG